MKEKNIEEKNIGKKRVSKKKILMIFLVVVLIIMVGLYVEYFQNSKRVIVKAFHHITTTIKEKYLMNKSVNIGNSYTVEADVNLEMKSEYLNQFSLYSPDALLYSNFLNNLGKTKNHLIFKQDQKNKKLLMSLESKYQDEELVFFKYLIENSKDYYYMKEFSNRYLEIGTNKYFESLERDINNKDNMEYIYCFILNSLNKHLKKSDFIKSSEKVNIGNREKNLQKISFELDNKKLVKISQLILLDLQKDKKASKIFTGVSKDFKKEKIEEDEEILTEKQKIIFSVYVGNITYSIQKYQLDIIDDKDIVTIDYQEDDKGLIHIYQNKKLEAILEITEHSHDIIIDICDGDKQSLGQVKITNEENSYGIEIDISDQNTKLQLSLKEELSKIKKNKSYQSRISLSGIFSENKQEIFNIHLDADSKVRSGAKIEESTKDALKSQEMDLNQKIEFQQKVTEIFAKLMS